MHPTIETSTHQIFAVVGSTYISERHSDEVHRYLPISEAKFHIDFEVVLRTLRSALALRHAKQ